MSVIAFSSSSTLGGFFHWDGNARECRPLPDAGGGKCNRNPVRHEVISDAQGHAIFDWRRPTLSLRQVFHLPFPTKTVPNVLGRQANIVPKCGDRLRVCG